LTELTLTEWFRSDISRMDIDRIIILLNGADIDRIFIDRFRIWPNYFIPVQNTTEFYTGKDSQIKTQHDSNRL